MHCQIKLFFEFVRDNSWTQDYKSKYGDVSPVHILVVYTAPHAVLVALDLYALHKG